MHVFPKFHRKTCSDPQPFLPVDLPLLLFGLPPSYQRNKHCGTNSVLVLIIWRAEEGVWFGEQKKEPSRDEKFAEMCKLLLYWMISVKIPDWINTSLTITSNLKQAGWKKDVGLSSSSPGQCVSKFHLSPKTTILDPQVLTDVQLKPNLVRSHPLASLLYSTSFCTILWYQHFWFKQAGWKEGRGSIIIFPRSMRFKLPFKP